jgi:hypothetical protein
MPFQKISELFHPPLVPFKTFPVPAKFRKQPAAEPARVVHQPPAPAPAVKPKLADMKWEYRDPKGVQHGPFSTAQMALWYEHRMLPLDLLMKSTPPVTADGNYKPLRQLFPPPSVPFKDPPASVAQLPPVTPSAGVPKHAPMPKASAAPIGSGGMQVNGNAAGYPFPKGNPAMQAMHLAMQQQAAASVQGQSNNQAAAQALLQAIGGGAAAQAANSAQAHPKVQAKQDGKGKNKGKNHNDASKDETQQTQQRGRRGQGKSKEAAATTDDSWWTGEWGGEWSDAQWKDGAWEGWGEGWEEGGWDENGNWYSNEDWQEDWQADEQTKGNKKGDKNNPLYGLT